MKTKKLKRLVSWVFIVNILITIPFAVSATPPRLPKQHYRSYSESYKSQIGLYEKTDNERIEEYRNDMKMDLIMF